MPAAGGIPGLRDGGISKTPSKKRFHTIASSTPSRTPGRSRDAVRQSNVSTPGAGMRLFQHAAGNIPATDIAMHRSFVEFRLQHACLTKSNVAH